MRGQIPARKEDKPQQLSWNSARKKTWPFTRLRKKKKKFFSKEKRKMQRKGGEGKTSHPLEKRTNDQKPLISEADP